MLAVVVRQAPRRVEHGLLLLPKPAGTIGAGGVLVPQPSASELGAGQLAPGPWSSLTAGGAQSGASSCQFEAHPGRREVRLTWAVHPCLAGDRLGPGLFQQDSGDRAGRRLCPCWMSPAWLLLPRLGLANGGPGVGVPVVAGRHCPDGHSACFFATRRQRDGLSLCRWPWGGYRRRRHPLRWPLRQGGGGGLGRPVAPDS